MSFIRKFLAQFRASQFAKNAVVLSLGALVAQGIMIASMPVLSRLYSPADFGVLAVFMALSGIVATATTLRYETAILLPKEDDESKAVVLLSATLALFSGLLIGLAAWLLPQSAKAALGISILNEWLLMAVVCGVATAMMATGCGWYNRQRAYVKISTLRMMQSGIGVVVGVVLGMWGLSSGLLWAQISASLTIALVIMIGLRSLRNNWCSHDFCAIAAKHSAAPKYLLPTALLDVVSLQLPVLLIGSRFSSDAVGQFSMAWKMLALPAALVGGAVAQVFFQKISTDIYLGIEVVWRRYIKVSKLLLIFAIAPLFLVSLYGAEFFSILLGEQWHQAGKMAEWLVFSSMMYFVFSPTTSIFLVLGKQKVLLVFGVVQLLYRVSVALVSDGVMEYIRWLVFCEFVNVVFFEFVLIYFLIRRLRLEKC